MTAAAAFESTTDRTKDLRQKLALLNGHSRTGRSRRYLEQRSESARVEFGSVAAVPAWMLFDEAAKRAIAMSVTLLAHRAAIDRELSGKRLGVLADAVGHDRMEALCDTMLPAMVDPFGRYALLPRPEDLEKLGIELLEAALPLALKDRYPLAADDTQARLLVDCATQIWRQTGAQEA
jgi:hypothetical protein